MPQVPLRIKKRRRISANTFDPFVNHWKKGLPFAKSRQGYLLHRVISASTHMRHGKPHHDSATFACNNFGGCPTFYELPPEGTLICETCERKVKKMGLPSSDELVGHHVHLGRGKATQVCCVPSWIVQRVMD